MRGSLGDLVTLAWTLTVKALLLLRATTLPVAALRILACMIRTLRAQLGDGVRSVDACNCDRRGCLPWRPLSVFGDTLDLTGGQTSTKAAFTARHETRRVHC